eukprot:4009894-Prorocentrum_lima.AAC.1
MDGNRLRAACPVLRKSSGSTASLCPRHVNEFSVGGCPSNANSRKPSALSRISTIGRNGEATI